MNNHRWTKFWWGDWQSDPALRMCGLAAQGLWMRLLCVMHDAEPVGHLLVNGRQPSGKQIAALVAAPEKEILALMNELEEAGVYSRTDEGVIYSRRMVRDAAATEAGRQWGKTGGNPTLKAKPNGSPNGGGLTPPDIHPPKPKSQPRPLTEGVGQGVNPEAKKQKKEEEGAASRLQRAREPRAPWDFLPTDWKPSEKCRMRASVLGFDEARFCREADKFRSHFGKSKATSRDWNSQFELWMNEAKCRDNDARPQAKSRNGFDAIIARYEAGAAAPFSVIDGDLEAVQEPRRLTHG